MIVAIDDQRPCIGADVVIRNAKAAQELLPELIWSVDELWLDHDLGEGQDIRPIVRQLELMAEYEKAMPGFFFGRPDKTIKVRILSDNPAGRQYIRQALERYFEVLP